MKEQPRTGQVQGGSCGIKLGESIGQLRNEAIDKDKLLKLVDDISDIRVKDLSAQIENNSIQIWNQSE